MNLMKIFRRHGRTLLMVFMALLLVAFLIPTSIQGCGERERFRALKRGEAYGHAITTDTLNSVRNELQLLAGAGFTPPVSPDQPLEYYLLTEEARDLGLRVGRDEVTSRLRQAGVTDEYAQRMEAQWRRSWDEICDTIGRWMSVTRLLQLQASAVFDSLPREALAYRNARQEAVAQLAVLDDRAFVPSVPAPTEAELQAFFEECKGRVPAHDEQKLEFGYRLPNRVRIEYLTVDPEQVKHKVQIKSAQLKQYFEDHAQAYTKPDPTATQPTQGPPPRVPMTLDEARELGREDLRQARAVEEAQSLVNEIYTDASRPWGAATKGEDGFTQPPEGETASFEELKQKFSTKFEVGYFQSALVDEAGLEQIPDFGQASLGEGQQRIAVPEMALRVPGIFTKDPNDRLPVLSLNEPAPVVISRRPDPRTNQSRPYQAFLFRVVEIRPSEPPASLDDVRKQVVEDWKLSQAHELAKAQAEALAVKAREIGLAAAVEQATDLKATLTAAEQAASQPAQESAPTPGYVKDLTPFSPSRLTREASFVENLGVVKDLPKELFALADEPATDTAPAHRLAVMPLANQFRWVIGELVEVKPIYEEAFQQTLAQAAQRPPNAELKRFATEWRSPELVQQRTGYISAPLPSGPAGPAPRR